MGKHVMSHKPHGRRRAVVTPKPIPFRPGLLALLSVFGVALGCVILSFYTVNSGQMNSLQREKDITIAPYTPGTPYTPPVATETPSVAPTPTERVRTATPLLKPVEGKELTFTMSPQVMNEIIAPTPSDSASPSPEPSQSADPEPTQTSDPTPVQTDDPTPVETDPPIQVCTGTILDPILCPSATPSSDPTVVAVGG